MAIGEDLNFHMARLGDEFLDQHAVIAKCRLGFPARAVERGLEILSAIDAAHALAAAPGHRLDQHRIADAVGLLGQEIRVLIRTVIARHDRHARLLHQSLGTVLEPHGADRIGGRADEHQPRGSDRLGEVRIFRQKAIARMDRLGAGGACGLDDGLGDKIAFARRRRADGHRQIGHGHMQRARIGLGIHRNGRDPEAPGGFDDPAGDFAPVGDENAAEHDRRILLVEDPWIGRRGPAIKRRRAPGSMAPPPSPHSHAPRGAAPPSVRARPRRHGAPGSTPPTRR